MGVLRVKLDDGTWVDVAGGTSSSGMTQADADARYVEGNATVTVGTTPPPSPGPSDLWVDTT